MLFKETLDNIYKGLYPAFEKLYQLILDNQTYDSDLLLVHLNAFYNPDILEWDNLDEKISPYIFGPNHEGHSEHTHYEFIGEYLQHNFSPISLEDHLKSLEYSHERSKEIEKLQFRESISIQTEMLIYLKVWESDTFIKKMYQLANLLTGNPYNWHYKLSTTSRTSGTTGTRDVIIRTKIRDKFKVLIPRLYQAFKNTYNFQIRNSIGHSQYSIIGNHIQLNNFVTDDPYSQLRVQSFTEWTQRFHETLVLYTLYHDLLRRVNDNYGLVAMDNQNIIPIRISREYPKQEIQYLPIYYRNSFKDWGWQPDI